MQWIDTHSHVFAAEFNADLHEVLTRARSRGIGQILMPNIDSESVEAMLNVARTYPGICLPMMGLHPCSVDDHAEGFLKKMPAMLQEVSYCAIGEIGIDLFWKQDNQEAQFAVFEEQARLGVEFDLPLVIHSRDSFHHCIRILKKLKKEISQPDLLRGVFHCFTGSMEEAREAIRLGFMLGIGGVLTYKTAKLPEVVQQLGLEHVILETDSPYLPPVPYRGKRNEPAYMLEVAMKLSQILNLDLQEVSGITSQNAIRLFNLPHEA